MYKIVQQKTSRRWCEVICATPTDRCRALYMGTKRGLLLLQNGKREWENGREREWVSGRDRRQDVVVVAGAGAPAKIGADRKGKAKACAVYWIRQWVSELLSVQTDIYDRLAMWCSCCCCSRTHSDRSWGTQCLGLSFSLFSLSLCVSLNHRKGALVVVLRQQHMWTQKDKLRLWLRSLCSTHTHTAAVQISRMRKK